jgi:2-polyprenyl-6-methoxyphenol hydroxylase-like FAD-dependent oxidoreductase
MKKLTAAIIGGSIAGCAAAIVLRKAGIDAQVFERSQASLEERGAGIAFPTELGEQLKAQGLISKEAPIFSCGLRDMVIKNTDDALWGKTIWSQPFNVSSMNWGTLFSNLRNGVDNYFSGYELSNAEQIDDSVQLTFKNGEQREFDFVIFADGYDSFGRQLLFPDKKPNYCDYVVWRGIVDTALLPDAKPFLAAAKYYLYEHGHALYYIIPKPGCTQDQPEYLLNWVLYEDLTGSDKRYPSSIAPGGLSDEQKNHLQQLADSQFPKIVSEVTRLTPKPFLQSIYDLELPHVAQDRMALIGDAATILRPHVAAGATKALQDALALGAAFQQHSDPVEALATWNQAQTQKNAGFAAVSKSIGKAMVTETIDWSAMTPEKMTEWWAAVMQGKTWYATSK